MLLLLLMMMWREVEGWSSRVNSMGRRPSDIHMWYIRIWGGLLMIVYPVYWEAEYRISFQDKREGMMIMEYSPPWPGSNWGERHGVRKGGSEGGLAYLSGLHSQGRNVTSIWIFCTIRRESSLFILDNVVVLYKHITSRVETTLIHASAHKEPINHPSIQSFIPKRRAMIRFF